MDTLASPEIANFLNSAMSRIAALEQQLQHSQTVISQLKNVAPAPLQTPPVKVLEPKVPLPEKFSGKRSTLKDFLTSVESVFQLQASRFPNDQIKILFVSTLLVDGPLAWFRTLKASSTNEQLFSDYNVFIKALMAAYGDPNAQKNAQRVLQSLTQGKRSVNAYATEFRRFSVDSGFDTIALNALFQRGLNNEIKDRLSFIEDLPTDFDKLIDLCIKLDARVQELRQEKSGVPHYSHHSALRPHYRPATTRMQNQAVPDPTSATPMELDSISKVHASSFKLNQPLSSSEKERRVKNKLCLYCGEPGHFRSSCPKRPSFNQQKPLTVNKESKSVQEQKKY